MRAIHLLGILALLAAAAVAPRRPRAPRPPTLPRRPPSRSACRIWFVWTAFPRSRPSPDGKRVAYTLRTTDMEANKGRTAIWLLDVRKRRCRAGAPHGSGRELDLARNGARTRASFIICRIAAARCRYGAWRRAASPLQVTNLPLDVGSFRVAPKADRVLVSLEVFPRLRQPRLHQAAAGRGRAPRGARRAVRQDLRPALGHVERRPPLAAVRDCARRCGPCERDAGQSDRRPRRRRAGQAVRRTRGLCDQPGRHGRWHSRCAQSRWASPGRPTSMSTRSPAAGGHGRAI